MTHALFVGTFVSALGIASSAFVLRTAAARRPRKLSLATENLLNGDAHAAIEKIFSQPGAIPVSDLVSLYWNSRFLVQEAHVLWLRDPADETTNALLEMAEDAHAKTQRYIRQHALERFGIGRTANMPRTSLLFLLDSYSEQLTILLHMQERNRNNGLAKFMGAF